MGADNRNTRGKSSRSKVRTVILKLQVASSPKSNTGQVGGRRMLSPAPTRAVWTEDQLACLFVATSSIWFNYFVLHLFQRPNSSTENPFILLLTFGTYYHFSNLDLSKLKIIFCFLFVNASFIVFPVAGV